MTTRVVTRDFTTSVVVFNPLSGTNTTLTSVGMYFRKNQSGNNQTNYSLIPAGYNYKGVPRYKKRYLKGVLDPHPYTMSVFSYINPIVHVTRPASSGVPQEDVQRTPQNLGFGAEPAGITWQANDELELLGRLHKKIAGSDFNLAVSLGQTGETLDTIADRGYKLYGALRALKHGNIRAAAKSLGIKRGRKNDRNYGQTLTSSWLELQYGWLPLIEDIYQAGKLLEHQLKKPTTMSVRASHKKGKTETNVLLPSSTKVRLRRKLIRKQIIAVLREKPSTATLSGFTDPLSVAWELLPYSFVFDWIYPLGNYLSERGFFRGINATYVTSTTTEFQSEGFLSAYDPVLLRTGFIIDEVGSTAKFHTVNMVRTVTTNLVVPRPNVKSLSQAFSWKRAANALSLINELNPKFPAGKR